MDCKNRSIASHLTDRPIEIAIDTEFQDTSTLTIQLAAFVDTATIAVKVYKSEMIPKPPKSLDLEEHFAGLMNGTNAKFQNLIKRPTSRITLDLSPAVFLRDLLCLPGLEAIPRSEGLVKQRIRDGFFGYSNAHWSESKRLWKIPTIKVILIGHFLPADFGRMFGTEFTGDILTPRNDGPRSLEVSRSQIVGFVERETAFRSLFPTVQFVIVGRDVFRLAIRFFDTNHAFGAAKLEAHCSTFLGAGKTVDFTSVEKSNMISTFRKRTADAYRYAIGDSISTLLVYQEMKKLDASLYHEFGIPNENIPPLSSTQGRRVANFILGNTAQSVAAGSALLKTRGDVRELLSRGGSESLDEKRVSRYGNVGQVHGGLVLTRSPTTFWHEGPGLLSDIDMSACYGTICQSLNVYWGQPIVFEPGSKQLSLRDAVFNVQESAAPDGWVIRVTGDIITAPNTLIPSTLDAITSANYVSGRANRRRQARAGRAKAHSATAKMFSQRVEAGIVTMATWLMIQALPEDLRGDYENLSADTIILYPRQLIAHDGTEYDELVERLKSDHLPWWETLDLNRLVKTEEELLDDGFASLRFPLGEVATKLAALRKKAQQQTGKGSGADKTFKEQANTMFGTLCSRHLPTNNIVAANQITATARTQAFALVHSLNGLQVNTDGCTFRRDRVPACTFAECLRRQPDYSLRHADEASGIPFVNSAKIPVDDAKFTRWYRKHVQNFFQIDGEGQRELFSMHRLEHKRGGEGKSPVFDALAADGCSNYVQCDRTEDGSVLPRSVSLRSYQSKFTSELVEWLISTYSTDLIVELPPLVDVEQLLRAKPAFQQCKKAFRDGRKQVRFPIGMPQGNVLKYSAIKVSAFVCQNERQALALEKHMKKFQEKNGCGLEGIAMRRAYKGRCQGSLTDLATQIYVLVNSGVMDFTKQLNLTRTSEILDAIAQDRVAELNTRRSAKDEAFSKLLLPGDVKRQPTGILLRNPDMDPLMASNSNGA